ncbi:hypothetical protein [Bacillus tuaregi]|uniref:hypothetical protein n=1 Tax=Bacillus tuaregi TaxID=1816695 RepID=UPI001113AE0F|nr:hypothetical protein [Bacillus tuaregi]
MVIKWSDGEVNAEETQKILEDLKNGVLTEYMVKKAEFLNFRQVLVKREDFRHFRGIAQRGGDVLFHYLKEPRS